MHKYELLRRIEAESLAALLAFATKLSESRPMQKEARLKSHKNASKGLQGTRKLGFFDFCRGSILRYLGRYVSIPIYRLDKKILSFVGIS